MSESMGGIILDCPGDFVGIGTQHRRRDARGNSGLPKVHLHNPVLAYGVGDEFMKPFHQGDRVSVSVPTPIVSRARRSSCSGVHSMEALALSPRDAAAFLGISKRTLTRLIADKTIVARKSNSRTLIDVASLKSYYAGLP
ncbi:MAG: helix-turn-helix domain-containing protein, partial [Xanthobacteraceae bacterium]